MNTNFDEALKRVLAHEGGYTNHPSDPGGPTNWGITINDARMYWKRDADADDVRAMPLDVAKRIYRSKYWDAMRCDELPSGVDYAVMDFGVNSGISRSIKYLEAIAMLPQDGKADDTLIRTVAHMPANAVITEFCNNRLAFLKRLNTWPVFGGGWGRRVAEVKELSLKMAAGGKNIKQSVQPTTGQAVPPPTSQKAKATGIAALLFGAIAGTWALIASHPVPTLIGVAAVVAAVIYIVKGMKSE